MKEHINQTHDIDISDWSKGKLEEIIIKFTMLQERNKKRLAEEKAITERQRLAWEEIITHSDLCLKQLKEELKKR